MKGYQEKCKQKCKQNDQEKQNIKALEIKQLTNLDVCKFLTKHNIKSDTALFAKAHEQKEAGKKDLAHFLMSRSSKALQDVIQNTWKMHTSSEKLNRQRLCRIEIIQQCADGKCVSGCDGVWLKCATEVLINNHTHPVVSAEALRDLLERGRGKFRNVLIVGPANCAKTFLLTPLTKIFETSSNPANDKYAWLGAELAEIIFLSDFRWTPEMIAWKELLLLLEGQSVHLP